jgi:hypothetical protein
LSPNCTIKLTIISTVHLKCCLFLKFVGKHKQNSWKRRRHFSNFLVAYKYQQISTVYHVSIVDNLSMENYWDIFSRCNVYRITITLKYILHYQLSFKILLLTCFARVIGDLKRGWDATASPKYFIWELPRPCQYNVPWLHTEIKDN